MVVDFVRKRCGGLESMYHFLFPTEHTVVTVLPFPYSGSMDFPNRAAHLLLHALRRPLSSDHPVEWKQRQHKKVKKSANGLMKKRTPEIWRRLSAVQKKARVPGRLIPGSRKESFSKLLEEAADYISALGMQVRRLSPT
ncbi:Transcription factor bHLH149 [Spatholobus suberectus]|nr:Transcription factor bHLH149 [Spatholobus suberectus]